MAELSVEASRKLLARANARSWRALEEAVEDLLSLHGWRWMHIRPALRKDGRYRTATTGHEGYFDYTAMRGGRVLFLEVKDGRGELSVEERCWSIEAEEAHRLAPSVQYLVVRRADVESGRLEEVLRRPAVAA
jgi:Holliday junction resolvase-like predicted endonuclease